MGRLSSVSVMVIVDFPLLALFDHYFDFLPLYRARDPIVQKESEYLWFVRLSNHFATYWRRWGALAAFLWSRLWILHFTRYFN
jgi:hypothetical protein